jgi:predicted  nucleic acid-binding Zn-ribbon protein
LKEDLKNAEMERVRILSKIHELQELYEKGEVRHSDINISYTFKSRTYAQIEDEYRDVLSRIRNLEDELDQTKVMILSNEQEIQRMKEDMDMIYSERGPL